jgi:hypothetical protein
MKRILALFLLIILYAGLTKAQVVEYKKHSLKAGYGLAFQGTGDMTAPVMDFEYSYRFSEHFGISPRIMFGNGKGRADSYGNYRLSNISTYDLSFTLYPFPKSFSRLSFDLGFSYRQVNGIMGYGYRQSDGNGGYQQYGNLNNYPMYKNEHAIGLTSVVDLRIIGTEKVVFGTKATNQAFYTNGDISWSLSGYLGVKF